MQTNNFDPLLNDFQYRLNKRFGKNRYTALVYNGNEKDADIFKRNINIFKRRVRNIIEAQLEVVDELDDVEL